LRYCERQIDIAKTKSVALQSMHLSRLDPDSRTHALHRGALIAAGASVNASHVGAVVDKFTGSLIEQIAFLPVRVFKQGTLWLADLPISELTMPQNVAAQVARGTGQMLVSGATQTGSKLARFGRGLPAHCG
jgi:hypothetical protein